MSLKDVIFQKGESIENRTFNNCKITNGNFINCTFSECSLDLQNSELKKCNIKESIGSLSNTNLDGCNLFKFDIMLNNCNVSSCIIRKLSGKCSESNFNDCAIYETYFCNQFTGNVGEVVCEVVTFIDCTLTG